LSFSTSAGYATKSGFYESSLVPSPQGVGSFHLSATCPAIIIVGRQVFCSWDRGHDRGIDDTKTFDTQNPMQWIKQRLSDHRPPHHTGSGGMKNRNDMIKKDFNNIARALLAFSDCDINTTGTSSANVPLMGRQKRK
jgi:hypothetical protein